MKALTYTSYKDSIVVNTCKIELARKDTILLSDVVVMVSKACLRIGVPDRHIKFTLSVKLLCQNIIKVKNEVYER